MVFYIHSLRVKYPYVVDSSRSEKLRHVIEENQ